MYARNSYRSDVANVDGVIYESSSNVHFFKHNNKWFICTNEATDNEQGLRIWRPGWSAEDIKKMIDNIDEKARNEDFEYITVYIPREQQKRITWMPAPKVHRRILESVFLEPGVMADLIQDISWYLRPATKKFLCDRGIPYRRGYLLHGKPGCGKTSFALAVATHWKLKIYSLSLCDKSITDVVLQDLVKSLQHGCLLLLEDIDSAGLSRETLHEVEDREARKLKTIGATESTPSSGSCNLEVSKKKGKPNSNASHRAKPTGEGDAESDSTISEAEATAPPSRVTLSCLLNILDGMYAPTGHIVIMTTNNPEALDYALRRDGRFDKKI